MVGMGDDRCLLIKNGIVSGMFNYRLCETPLEKKSQLPTMQPNSKKE